MTGKLGIGCYSWRDSFLDILAANAASTVLLYGHEVLQQAPRIRAVMPQGCLLIGRLPNDDVVLSGDGPWGFGSYDKGYYLAESYLRYGYDVDVWQGSNERVNEDTVAVAAQFEAGFGTAIQKGGKKCVLGNIAAGNLSVEEFRLFRPAMEVADYLGYHAYSNPLMENRPEDFALRFLSWKADYEAQGWRFPPVLLTETGPYVAWRGVLSPTAVATDYCWLGKMIKDLDVVGSNAFCLGDSGGWGGFDLENEPFVLEMMAAQNKLFSQGGNKMDPIEAWLKDMWARQGVSTGGGFWDYALKVAQTEGRLILPQYVSAGIPVPCPENHSVDGKVLAYTIPPLLFDAATAVITEGFFPKP